MLRSELTLFSVDPVALLTCQIDSSTSNFATMTPQSLHKF